MKVLHTADVHLREYRDERWEALLNVIEVGKHRQIDILTICGDLFDGGVDAESLRPQIREVFSDTGFKVLIIPGNHDVQSFKEGMYFGEDVLILGSTPVEYGEARVIGLPFEPIHGEQLLKRIRDLETALTPDKTNLLLCHCELLDAFFSRADFGPEGEGRYMPFKLSYLEGLNVEYVLAGHFHSNFDVWRLKNGGYFVYPGTPISITRAEIGQRKVNLFEVGGPPSQVLLDTFHFHEVSVELDPFRNENPVQLVQEQLEKLHPKAASILAVKGYFNSEQLKLTESDVVTQIRGIATGKCIEERYEFKDVAGILENDLFKSFMSEAGESGYSSEEIQRLQDITIRAMMRAGL